LVEVTGGTIGTSWHDHENDLIAGMSQVAYGGGVGSAKDNNGNKYQRIDKGLHPTCTCNAATRAGIVLDPFMGSGTVALVARRLSRHYLGCDLNADYVAMANRRLAETDPYQDKVRDGFTQHSLFAEDVTP
jgi:hypothetical protein